MDNHLYQQKEKQQRKEVAREQTRAQRGNYCPHCGAEITDTCELCPVCGRPVDDSTCPFCGAPYEGDEPFCAECGSPRAGIKCPKCGTLSFRSFCRQCNTPLNDNAAEAIAHAKRDPHFRHAQQLNEELAQMEAYLYRLKEEIERAIADDEIDGDAPDMPGLSNEGEKLRNQYAELMKLLGQQPNPQQHAEAKPKPKVNRKRELKLKFHDADKIMEAYRQKQAEMEQTLKAMIPDANMTPAQQRDYCCARKVATVTIEKGVRPTVWECNFCHFLHSQPSECAEPWHGGTWHHEEITIEKKVWNYLQ